MTTTSTALRDVLAAKCAVTRASREHARAALADAVTSGSPARTLTGYLLTLAEADAVASLWERTAAINSGRGPAAARENVLDLVLAGADDTWSGRGNDVARATFDGTRRAASDVLFTLDAAAGA